MKTAATAKARVARLIDRDVPAMAAERERGDADAVYARLLEAELRRIARAVHAPEMAEIRGSLGDATRDVLARFVRDDEEGGGGVEHAEVLDWIDDAAARLPGAERRCCGPIRFDSAEYWIPRIVLDRAGSRGASRTLCVAGGIHGNEPDGVVGVVRWMRRIADDPQSVAGIRLLILPLMNPVGCRLLTRGNGNGVDLNRSFVAEPGEPEIPFWREALRGFRFGGCVTCHSDPDASDVYAWANWGPLSVRIARGTLREALPFFGICPGEEIDGEPARDGIIDGVRYPGAFRPDYAAGIEPIDITLETPGLASLSRRADAHAAMLRAAVRRVREAWTQGAPPASPRHCMPG